jgi:cell division protein FtsI (penicillin-binding protein 3)
MPPRTGKGGGAGRKPHNRPSAHRPGILLVILLAMLSVVAGRLAWIQVVQAKELTATAAQQRLRDLTLPPRRGSIFDREGQPLAVTTDAKTVYAVPTQVKDATATASALARILGGEPETYLKSLKRKGSFAYLARKVDLPRAEALEKLSIDGIGFIDDARRTFPSGRLAGQVLGFVGVDDVGLEGIEKQYDSTLAGTPGRMVAERDPKGHLIPGSIVTAAEPVDGQDIYLTIDKDIQNRAEIELAGAVKKFHAKGGTVIVLDPTNGEILAIASTPFFDPNEYGAASADAMRNKAITDTYEPGSTMKAMTAAAVIDRGLFTPESMFRLPPTLRIGGRTIHEAHARGTVNYSLSQIVTHSSNIGAVKLGQALGKTALADYISRFHLSRKTGVDFPGEASGWMPPISSWSASTMGNLPFGQGLSVTPLQLARAVAAIANGGTLVTPHFLSRQGSIPATFPASPESVISKATATAMTRMLTDVVRDGTGTEAAVRQYEVAGKTGTAQKVRAGGGGYMRGVYVSSFIGFLPASAPRVLILVTIDSPRRGLYGGTVAAPAFSHLARFCVDHLKIAPAPSVGPVALRGTASSQVGNKAASGAHESTRIAGTDEGSTPTDR